MLNQIHRQRLEAFAAGVERHRVVPILYIGALCLVYLMHNIWTARTVFDFTVMPLALCLVRRSDLKPILASPLFLLAGLYFALITLAAMAAGDASAILIANHVKSSFQVLAFLAITALLIRRDPDFPKSVFLFLAGSAAIAAVVNLIAFLRLNPDGLMSMQFIGIPGVSMYYNANVLGDVYAIACAGSFALLAGGGLSRLRLATTLCASVILLLALALIMSRGALLATLAAALVAFLLSGGWKQRRLIVVALGLGLSSVALTTPVVAMLWHRGDAFRFSLWRVYLDLAWQRPWLGYGLAFDTQIVLRPGLLILNPHNIVLSALIRGGLISAATLVCLLAAAIYRAWRNWIEQRSLFAPVLLAAALAATSVDYEIVATPLGWPWLLLWLPVGLALGAGADRSGSEMGC